MDSLIVTDTVVPLPASPAHRKADGSLPTPRPRAGHFAWIDIRGLAEGERNAYLQAALHHRVDGIVSDDPAVLADLPPTVRRVLVVDSAADQVKPGAADVVIGEGTPASAEDAEGGVHVVVSDAPTLTVACQLVREVDWTLLTFTDPTKIPLEIVIAAAENSTGRTVTVVNDITDAGIVALVLEHGSDGVLLKPRAASDIATLQGLIDGTADHLELVELIVDSIEHIGIGERACIDTCSLLEPDEGVLVGSFSTGLFLSCSETHPLPYMPTRPFRWNAAAVHSYVLGPDNRTRYVSELRAGMPVTMSGLPAAPGDSFPAWITTVWPPENLHLLDHQWRVAIDYWGNLAAEAERRGIKIAIEMHANQLVYSVPGLLRLREAVGPTVGVNFDPSHLFWMGADPLAAIEALQGTIHHVHAKDTRIEERAAVRSRLETVPNDRIDERAWNYVAVGTGHPDGPAFWRRFADALRTAGYDGVLSIENEDYSLSQPDSVAIAARTLTEALQP